MSAFEEGPPRVGRAMWKRFAIGMALVVALAAAPTATALLLQVKDAVDAFERFQTPLGDEVVNVLDDVPAGTPQNLLIVGSDARFIDRQQGNPVRSDTMLVARLDPDKNKTAVMSIPRDLLVDIPGVGRGRINTAYAIGGPELAIRTVRDLLGEPIHHIVTVEFRGFRGAVDQLGCVYIDVDRRYFNDNNPPNNSPFKYAEIDLKPGYQKLCGQDALDYVRFRHLDDDFVRAARQQSFLAQAKQQISVGELFGDREKLLEIFGRYTQTDIQGEAGILRLLKLAYEASQNPVQSITFRATPIPGEEELLEISDSALRETVDEFLAVEASEGPRQTEESSRAGGRPAEQSRRSEQRERKGLARGLTRAKTEGEDHVLDMQTRLEFPVYFPAVRLGKGGYVESSPAPDEKVPRSYDLFDREGNKYRAYRIVLAQGDPGQYYGVQGTTWKAPPMLDNPSEKREMRGRTYELFYDGNRLRLVAWRTSRAVYWVSNTLSKQLTNGQMLDIARSLQRIGQ